MNESGWSPGSITPQLTRPLSKCKINEYTFLKQNSYWGVPRKAQSEAVSSNPKQGWHVRKGPSEKEDSHGTKKDGSQIQLEKS